jgi:hypothetical protein
MKSVIVIVALVFAGSSSIAFGVGAAGCGLGSVIIKKNSIMSQTLAMSTNGSFSSQFFGITSGTSNCNAKGFTMKQVEAVNYAEANYQDLQIEMARGAGEKLNAFASLLGCASAAEFGAAAKANYSSIYNDARVTAVDVVERTSAVAGCRVTG